MKKLLKINVGSMDDMGRRFISAWKRAESGEKVCEQHLTFPSLEAMMAALSPKRLELLRNVHRDPAQSVRALAQRLGRDYKRVHEDVDTLAAVGLIKRDELAVSVPYDAINAELRL